MNSISLRRANIEDLTLLQHWNEQPHVIASNPNDQWDWEPELQLQTIWIDPLECNKNAIRFYERLGFEFVEKRRFGEDDCAVYRLKRED